MESSLTEHPGYVNARRVPNLAETARRGESAPRSRLPVLNTEAPV